MVLASYSGAISVPYDLKLAGCESMGSNKLILNISIWGG
jgi:hypothetical protein